MVDTSVSEQTGIFTGDGGFRVNVQGKTSLKGGAITSSAQAQAQGLNQFESAGGIDSRDLQNSSSYKGSSIQAGLSVGQNRPAQVNGIGYGKDKDSQSRQTLAGITGVAGHQQMTTDTQPAYAGVIANRFDAGQVNAELGAQAQITQAFSDEVIKQTPNIVNAVKTASELVDNGIEAISRAKQAEQARQRMTEEERAAFDNVTQLAVNDIKTQQAQQPLLPALILVGEATETAALTCVRIPACVNAVVNLFGAATATAILHTDDKDKKPSATPKPLPSTSGSSATGMPPDGDENENTEWDERSFNVDSKQLGKKLGKHVSDFGESPANAADRQYVQSLIENIGKNPDKVVRGTFAGQGPAGTRGAVQFRIKGEDVVVTKPNGTFVTILRNGTSNPSVQQALYGAK